MKVRRHPVGSVLRSYLGPAALAAFALAAALGLLAAREPIVTAEAAFAGVAVAAPAAAVALDATGEARLDAAAEATPPAEAEAPPPSPKPRKHARRSRQSLAMPYFSFARS